MAGFVFLASGGSVLVLLLKGHKWEEIVNIAVTIFDVVVLSYGMGFFVPAFLTSLSKMGMAVEMSRKGLEVGQQTAQMIKETKEEMQPLVKDVKEVVNEIRPAVKDVTQVVHKLSAEFEKVLDELRSENGQFTSKISDTVKKAILEARAAFKDGETEVERWIFEKVDSFLGDVFGGDENGNTE